jgi:hypothetical protein
VLVARGEAEEPQTASEASHTLPKCDFWEASGLLEGAKPLIFDGGRTRARTLDPLSKSQLLWAPVGESRHVSFDK